MKSGGDAKQTLLSFRLSTERTSKIQIRCLVSVFELHAQNLIIYFIIIIEIHYCIPQSCYEIKKKRKNLGTDHFIAIITSSNGCFSSNWGYNHSII